ncbi:MAG: hypothetical protein GYA21_14845 [Myxococcales bacterium]|nr:hypothetical protein [Myxococcales bacterium]
MRWLTFAICLLLSGCAARLTSIDMAAPEDREIASLEEALRQKLGELDGSLSASPTPDCPHLCELSATICQLGERICAIAGRRPELPDLSSRCQDARKSCDSARTRVAKTCACE